MSEIVFLPGWGMSSKVFLELRAQLAALRTGARAKEQRIVIGWSLGAQAALERARGAPHAIERLVLISATPCFVKRDDWPHGIDAHVFEEFARALDRDATGTLDRFVVLQAQGDADAKRVARVLRRAQSDADVRTLAAGLRSLLETDLRPALHAIGCPALVIHGECDTLVPRGAAEYLAAALPQARCEIIPDAAHAPFVSDAARVAKLIGDFTDG